MDSSPSRSHAPAPNDSNRNALLFTRIYHAVTILLQYYCTLSQLSLAIRSSGPPFLSKPNLRNDKGPRLPSSQTYVRNILGHDNPALLPPIIFHRLFCRLYNLGTVFCPITLSFVSHLREACYRLALLEKGTLTEHYNAFYFRMARHHFSRTLAGPRNVIRNSTH